MYVCVCKVCWGKCESLNLIGPLLVTLTLSYKFIINELFAQCVCKRTERSINGYCYWFLL